MILPGVKASLLASVRCFGYVRGYTTKDGAEYEMVDGQYVLAE
jgi:hypothetical protein